MRPRRALLLAACAVLLGAAGAAVAWRHALVERLPPTWRIALSAWRHDVKVDHEVRLAMPDGVKLAASLYLPRGAGRRPAILIRVPYHRLRYPGGFAPASAFAAAGYAVLVQDLRGTGDSGGELLPWRDATADGAATLDWIVAQPWSDGKVGAYGCSALGETQLALAKARHPALRAMIAEGAGGAVGRAAGAHNYFGVFEGGVLQLASAVGWFVDHGAKDPAAPAAPRLDRAEHLKGLPVIGLARAARGAATGLEDYLATPLGDARWDTWGFLADTDRTDAATFFVDSWGDQSVGATLALAESWRRADPASARRLRVVIAPTRHCNHRAPGPGAYRFGELEVRGAARPWDAWYRGWFDHWLRGGPATGLPGATYHYFMMGEDRWLEASQWPPAEARIERWHLASGGNANSSSGDGVLAREPPARQSSDAFRYDPRDPAPSRGGPICCTGLDDRPGPAEQSDVERRRDVLVYTSAPLAAPLRIAGFVKARLTVSSSAPDTDLVARIADVFPDGRSIGLQEGALRLRYRDGLAAPAMMEPGRRYEVEVDMRAIAHAIAPGHRLRLQVTSSSFPRLERNLNTGAPDNALETRIEVAENRLHHGGEAKAWLELAVLPP